MSAFGIIFLLLTAAVSGSEKARYDGYRVYTVVPKTQAQLQAVFKLNNEYDFWKYSNGVDTTSDILVPPEMIPKFKNSIRESGMTKRIKIDNVQALIDLEGKKLRNRGFAMEWKNYHKLSEIYEWLDVLCEKYKNVECVTGGRSYYDLKIKGIQINFGKDLPGIFIESGIHAREWIGPATTTWMINEILKSPVDSIFRKFNYVYFPVFNPDGYNYTWTTDRLWRKTRTPYKHGNVTTAGADPNRNWDFHWNESGASDDPNSNIYAGPCAFSEIEMKTISEYIKSIAKAKKLDIYIAFHSYGQQLLYPWGYTKTLAPHNKLWEKIGESAAKAYNAVHNNTLTYGPTATALYLMSGSGMDWFYGNYNSTISFTIEMRDNGKYGFVLPPEQIIPNSEEFFAVFKSVLTEYLKLKKN